MTPEEKDLLKLSKDEVAIVLPISTAISHVLPYTKLKYLHR